MIPHAQKTLIALALISALPAQAMEFKLGNDLSLDLNATVTAGTYLRTDSPSPGLYGPLSAARVGATGAQLGGNSGGSDLNFEKNQAVSTVVKGLFDANLRYRDIGVFARAKAWYDQELSKGDRAYGNSVNGFAQNVPLSDQGYARDAKFQGARFTEVYGYGKFDFGGGHSAELRGGRQVLNWGAAQMVGGGINTINGVDAPAASRPGFLADETRVAAGTVLATVNFSKSFGLDAFSQYEFKPTVANGCGTFFAQANYVPTGCNYVSVLGAAGVNDPTALSSNRYPKRAPDALADDNGQWGVSGRYSLPKDLGGGDVRLYAMNTHSKYPYINVVNANIAGGYGANATVRLTDPNGVKYQIAYPEDIKLYGISINTPVSQSVRLFGEYSYRPDQPLAYSPSDLIAAFLNRGAASNLQLNRQVLSLPPGATFQGYERFAVSMATLGAGFVLPNLAGSQRINGAVEVGYSKINGLPSPSVRRFGRSDDYGVAAYTGGAACVETTPAAKTCATEGFITGNSWGWRARLSGTWTNLVPGVSLTPSLALAGDVTGNSYQPIFVEGRWVVRPGLRVDWKQTYLDMFWHHTGGGAYNTQADRSFVSAVLGFKL